MPVLSFLYCFALGVVLLVVEAAVWSSRLGPIGHCFLAVPLLLLLLLLLLVGDGTLVGVSFWVLATILQSRFRSIPAVVFAKATRAIPGGEELLGIVVVHA